MRARSAVDAAVGAELGSVADVQVARPPEGGESESEACHAFTASYRASVRSRLHADPRPSPRPRRAGRFPAAAHADAPPPGSKWTQAFITEADGTKLHADILRPANLPVNAKTPVILSIGPYFNHSGQTGPAGPIEDTPYTPTGEAGPSARFYDFINGAKLMEKGYTWVQVDLRGFGGSSGCLDWGGPGEQADVKAAVEWAARQPWSTGKVGMYGKSYDGVTGLIGIAQQPQGLAAVVSQEPVYDLYRYLYTNRVRFENSLATPALYDAIAATPGTTGDTLAYNLNALNSPACLALNYARPAEQRPRLGLLAHARPDRARRRGKATPLFLTQGFIENNTKPDGTWDLYNGLTGPKRAWFGMWDHVRGNDVDANGRLLMGRQGWFDETMRFFDRYVKGADGRRRPGRTSSRPATARGAPRPPGRRPTPRASTPR